MKHLLILLMMYGSVFGASEKFLVYTDAHGNSTKAPASQAIQDGGDYRVFTNYQERLLQACAVGVAENCDAFVLLGDNLHSSDLVESGPNGWATMLTTIEAEFSDKTSGTGTIIPVMGNHDHTVLEVSEFGAAYAAINGFYKVGYTGAIKQWPGALGSDLSCNFAWNDTNFMKAGSTSFAHIDTIWDDTGVTYETALTNATSQLAWFEDRIFTITGKPLIIFSHYHLSDEIGDSLPTRILSGVPTSPEIAIQAQIAEHVVGGDEVYVFQGHLHKVIGDPADDTTKATALWSLTTIRYTIDGALTLFDRFHIDDQGDLSGVFPDSSTFTVEGSDDNDGTYTVVSTLWDDPSFQVTVAEVPANGASGTITPSVGAKYYSFRGAVLGKSATDLRGNTCFVVTVDTVTGVSIKTYQFSSTARDRYNPHDIDNVMGTNQRRSRHSN